MMWISHKSIVKVRITVQGLRDAVDEHSVEVVTAHSKQFGIFLDRLLTNFTIGSRGHLQRKKSSFVVLSRYTQLSFGGLYLFTILNYIASRQSHLPT